MLELTFRLGVNLEFISKTQKKIGKNPSSAKCVYVPLFSMHVFSIKKSFLGNIIME